MQKENHLYGLIGYPLSHSFSQKYFTEKFQKEGLKEHSYLLFPIIGIGELPLLLEQEPELRGFNVTIPYKEKIIAYLDEMDVIAEKTGAVNTVKVSRADGKISLKGYNTDVYGFSQSLKEWFSSLYAKMPCRALILGSGGASKAVVYALNCMNIIANVVSRKAGNNIYKTYEQLDAADFAAHHLIINTTPLGMFPVVNECPALPYQYLSGNHYLYELVYNPSETLFMQKGLANGANVCNGERMLHLQADRAWVIWKD